MKTRSKKCLKYNTNEKPTFKIIEKEPVSNIRVTYNNLLSTVNNTYNNIKETEYSSDFAALQLHYNENYLKKELEFILGYYGISKRKKNKMDIVNDISLFELNDANKDIVDKRKLMWFYLDEINGDNYLKNFLILD